MPEILRPRIAERVASYRPEPPDPQGGWLERYDRFGLSALSPTAREVVHADSAYITDQCIVLPGRDSWPSSRVRTGIVVGAVQSGKTASMLAVSARLLDRGLDILIVLAGTRIALWRQTYERLLHDLDGTDGTTFKSRRKQRLLIPHPASLLDAEARPGAPSYMARETSTFANSLLRKRPVVIVIPKLEDHLLAVSKFLEEHVAAEAAGRRVELVVLDDEADDGSVLDAEARKIIPRRIEMLWTGRQSTKTLGDNLYATYVAYTATPQANLLQAHHNPLSPRHFCAALRTPYKSGALSPRDVAFNEPLGIRRYYCGGEMFYVEVADSAGPLVQSRPFPARGELSEVDHLSRVRASADALLLHALRSFLVSAGLRLLQQQAKRALPYSAIQDGIHEDDLDRLPKPHGMLVHPSARLQLHAHEAWRLVLLSRGVDPDHPDAPAFDHDDLRLSVDGLRHQIMADPSPWVRWLEAFSESRARLELLPDGQALLDPHSTLWVDVSSVLLDEIIPHVRIRIINSDPGTNDRPRFSAIRQPNGVLMPPEDLLAIFVSGNVMSRGLTIEGLHTSVFTRPANEPAADTQMQMQRWFGYRGASVHLCRLFCFDDQAELFRTYHEHDTALRREILVAMDAGAETSPLTVLAGSRSLATAKVRTTRLPLHPGPTPYVRLLETESHAQENAQLLDGLLGKGEWKDVQPKSKVMGRIREHTATLEEVAAMLDQLRYTHHDPDPESGVQFTRWASLQRQHGIADTLFRPPGANPGPPAIIVTRCPYSIAAYLRLWAEALVRPRCDGLYWQRQPWAMVQPTLTAPRFYIGLRYGSLPGNSWESKGLLAGVRAMSRSVTEDEGGMVQLSGAWGTRGDSAVYSGDQWFDYYHDSHVAPPTDRSLGRPVGHPGLLLFQMVHAAGHARDAVAVGLALPSGGPEQFAAVRPGFQP